MYVCLCRGITESEFHELITRHAGSLEGVKQAMGFDESCCGCCEANLEDLLKQVIQPTIE